MAQLPPSSPTETNQKLKRRKKQKTVEEDAPAAAAAEESPPKKKGRRQLVDETILGRYHQSQKLQGILKKKDDHLEEEENVPVTSSDEIVPEEVRVTASEQTEADQVLEDVNQLEREAKKRLAKEKKKFKAQQKKLQKQQQLEKEEPPKESKQEKALAYMKQWKRRRDEWKFKKINHIWLLKNWKHSGTEKGIPDRKFKTFLKYLKSTEQKSLALQRLQQEAKSIVDGSKAATAEADDDDDQEEAADSSTSTSTSTEHQQSIERARSILQWTV